MTYEVAKEAVASSVAWGVAEVLPFGSQAAGGGVRGGSNSWLMSGRSVRRKITGYVGREIFHLTVLFG